MNFTLHCLLADGSPHPNYPVSDEWVDDPFSHKTPILLTPTSWWEKGGAKDLKQNKYYSQAAAEGKGANVSLHLPNGAAGVVVRSRCGRYCAHYAIETPETTDVILPSPDGTEIGVSVISDPYNVGWRILWWWDTLPCEDPDSDVATLLGLDIIRDARLAGILPGTGCERYHVLGANLRPAFARLLMPRVKPDLPVMKKKGRRK